MTASNETSVGAASGAGAASLAGYEYQIDVSVWLALDLVVVSQLSGQLVLEPASQEDLEADVDDFAPGRVVSHAAMDGYKLVVQAKLRRGDAWTQTTLKTLLDHGGDRRASAAARLEDAKYRYLLVTSAGVNGDARKLVQRRAGTWPPEEAMPSAIRDGFEHDFAGRVSIVANQDEERLRGDVERLLAEGCRVPNARLAECRLKLREDARARIAGANGGRWGRPELEAVIRSYDGYLASAPELDSYVHPTNWASLRTMMRERSAAILVGRSGTGKTLATRMLFDELRKEIPGLTRVPIRLGPYQLRDDSTPPPVLFDIEDPWGRFDFDPTSRPWNDLLQHCFSAARSDRLVVATSRFDVAEASGALASVSPWIVRLEAEDYGDSERKRLYLSRIDGLPRELQLLAKASQAKVLDALESPLEIQKFFDALRTNDRARAHENPDGFVAAAIDQAHQNSIEQTVIDQISARDDVRAASIVWGLLAAGGKFARAAVREIEDALADRHVELERGITPFIDFMVAARNLRQSDGGAVAYYHPRVEAGITRSLEGSRQLARRTLTQLVEYLAAGLTGDSDWGRTLAVRVYAAAADKFRLVLSAAAIGVIDAWLDGRTPGEHEEVGDLLSLASRCGSAGSNLGEIARFLLHRPDLSFGGMDSWGKPEREADWYAARRRHPSTKRLLEAFVRDELPRGRIYYPDELTEELYSLCPDLNPAFLDAARDAVGMGILPADNVIIRGALADLEDCEIVVDAAVECLTPTAAEATRTEQLHLDLVNEVYSPDYAEHLAQSDDGYTADAFLKAYVDRAVDVRGWAWVSDHRHAVSLLPYWLRKIDARWPGGAVPPEELAKAFDSSYGGSSEGYLWHLLAASWEGTFLPALKVRLRDGSAHDRVELAALECALLHHEDLVASTVDELFHLGQLSRVLEISLAIATLRVSPPTENDIVAQRANRVAQQLPSTFAQLCDAEASMLQQGALHLSTHALEQLVSISGASDAVRTLRITWDKHVTQGSARVDDVDWALDHSDSHDVVAAAAEVAARRGWNDKLEVALQHRFAHAAACAVRYLDRFGAGPLPQRLLSMATHRASPVKLALVSVMKDRPHPKHIDPLLLLSKDRWSREEFHYADDYRDYPIARAAVAAITDLFPLGEGRETELFKVGVDTSDPQLRRAIFDALARTGLHWQKQLLSLADEPGKAVVRVAAAHALLQAESCLDQAIIDGITPRQLETKIENVAAALALLMGHRGSVDAVRAAAAALAANQKRRVFVLLLICMLRPREPSVAKDIARMLPAAHVGVDWALGEPTGEITDVAIADLGSPSACSVVLRFVSS